MWNKRCLYGNNRIGAFKFYNQKMFVSHRNDLSNRHTTGCRKDWFGQRSLLYYEMHLSNYRIILVTTLDGEIIINRHLHIQLLHILLIYLLCTSYYYGKSSHNMEQSIPHFNNYCHTIPHVIKCNFSFHFIY